MTTRDEFGDRMKAYESAFTQQKIGPEDILCVRIDGKGFSKYTRGFDKPFDEQLSEVMIRTTEALVRETHARLGYTQSDEITLVYRLGDKASEYMFGGKTSKLNSVLASIATANFNYFMAPDKIPVRASGNPLAYFDCRSFAVPDLIEASNVVLWRTQDARKNSISALFRWTAGHKAMDRLGQADMKKYLKEHHDVDWNDLPNKWKYGTYVKPVVKDVILSGVDLSKIPERNRPESGSLVKRTVIERIDIGYYGDMDLEQRVEFVS